MKGFVAMLLLLFISCLYFVGDVKALAVPKENLVDEAVHGLEKQSKTDEDPTTELREQVSRLQQAVAEITRSFLALELAAKNPYLVKNLAPFPNENDVDDPNKTRLRRDTDSQSSSNSSSSVQQSNLASSVTWQYTWLLIYSQCLTCPAGIPGPRGPPGPQGISGRDGRDGRDAPIKPQDQESSYDKPNPTPVPSDRATVTNTSQPGVVYIRWGNSVCPEKAELIYKGTVGGALYSHNGSGANYLCMPDEPVYDEIEAGNQEPRARLYSSEYQMTSNLGDRLSVKSEHTPTCAVCRAPSGYTTKLMIPARNVCPSSEWRLEYAGYLMAERYTTKRTEFLCVDREMDVEPGTQGNQQGALLYMVEGRCLTGGGLPCGPYIDGNELTCAVCTF